MLLTSNLLLFQVDVYQVLWQLLLKIGLFFSKCQICIFSCLLDQRDGSTILTAKFLDHLKMSMIPNRPRPLYLCLIINLWLHVYHPLCLSLYPTFFYLEKASHSGLGVGPHPAPLLLQLVTPFTVLSLFGFSSRTVCLSQISANNLTNENCVD